MSAWSRAPAEVRWTITAARLAKDEARREHIRDAQPITREQMIADIRRGIETADMIRRDIHDCRANRRTDPLRYAIDLTKEAHKRSMLVALIADIGRLLRDLGVEVGRKATP